MYYIFNNHPRLVRKRYVFTWVLLLLSTALFADKLGFNFTNNKKQTKIKFKIIDNLIVMPVSINDKLRVNLILDTGGRTLVLFGRRFAKKLDVIPNKEVILNGYGKMHSRKAELSIGNKVNVADVEGRGIGIIVTKDKNFFSDSNLTNIHGIIGYSIFSRFVVMIDYYNQEITLSEPTNFCSDKLSFNQMDLVVKDTKPYIKASWAHHNYQKNAFFHIDTGSARELILFMKDGDEQEEFLQERTWVGKGLNGTISGYRGVEVDLALRNEDVEKISPYFINREFSNREITDAAGSIGGGFLKNYVIIFDYVNEKFYYKKVD